MFVLVGTLSTSSYVSTWKVWWYNLLFLRVSLVLYVRLNSSISPSNPSDTTDSKHFVTWSFPRESMCFWRILKGTQTTVYVSTGVYDVLKCSVPFLTDSKVLDILVLGDLSVSHPFKNLRLINLTPQNHLIGPVSYYWGSSITEHYTTVSEFYLIKCGWDYFEVLFGTFRVRLGIY